MRLFYGQRWYKDNPSALKRYYMRMMSSLTPTKSKPQTDWDKCCLCQADKKEDLKSPTQGSTGHDSYSKLATNIPLFQAINQIPLILDQNRLDEGSSIEETY